MMRRTVDPINIIRSQTWLALRGIDIHLMPAIATCGQSDRFRRDIMAARDGLNAIYQTCVSIEVERREGAEV